MSGEKSSSQEAEHLSAARTRPEAPSQAGDWRKTRSPADPWLATRKQSRAADLRVGLAAAKSKSPRVTVNVRDLRLVLHDKGIAEMDAEACGWVREAAKRATGGNCSFADDDLHILEHLAMRAIDAGLTDGLHSHVAAKARALAEERAQSSQTPTTQDARGEAEEVLRNSGMNPPEGASS